MRKPRGSVPNPPFSGARSPGADGPRVPTTGGVPLSGRWSWATGVMDGNWIIVGALCAGLTRAIYPALALLPDR